MRHLPRSQKLKVEVTGKRGNHMKDTIKRMLYKSQKLLRKPEIMCEENAIEFLWTKYPQKKICYMAENEIDIKFDLLIIVPVYNVEKYVDQCVESILNQKTKYNYWIILIDDGSTDESGKIIDKYNVYSNVTIVHKKNKGVADARNLGMSKLTGQYLMFVDSDDYIPSCDALERLLETAYTKNADIVAGNFFRFSIKDGIIKKQMDAKLRKYRDGDELNPVSDLQGFPWGKIYKAELFSDVCFPVGFWYEDSIISWIIYPRAKQCYFVDVVSNAYRNNPTGQSAAGLFSLRAIESTYLTKALVESISENNKQRMDIYELFLTQAFLNIQRVRNTDDKTIRAVFSVMCDLKQTCFVRMQLDGSASYKNKEIETALDERDFSRMKQILRWL